MNTKLTRLSVSVFLVTAALVMAFLLVKVNQAQATSDINTPPDCSNAASSVAFLWPPTGMFRTIDVNGVTDSDGDALTIAITAIFQDEPVTGAKNGVTSPDGMGVGTSAAGVRAERSGKGDGRVYAISFTADDGNGGTCTGTVVVAVPLKGPNGSAVDSGTTFDSTVT